MPLESHLSRNLREPAAEHGGPPSAIRTPLLILADHMLVHMHAVVRRYVAVTRIIRYFSFVVCNRRCFSALMVVLSFRLMHIQQVPRLFQAVPD